MERYHDLAFEIKRVLRVPKVAMIATVIVALGTTSKNAKPWLEQIDLPDIFGSVQLSAIFNILLTD